MARHGVSLSYLAGLAAAEARGEVSSHPLAPVAKDIICEAIRRMVYKLAHEYSASCNECVDDLAQDCLRRITERIGGFEPAKGSFTTWAWRVCGSVLVGAWRRESSRNYHIASVDVSDLKGDFEPRTEFDSAAILRSDILEAIDELTAKYPEREPLLSEIFGGFVARNLCSSKLEVAKAAKKLGMTYNEASTFVESVVRPYFKSRFALAAV